MRNTLTISLYALFCVYFLVISAPSFIIVQWIS